MVKDAYRGLSRTLQMRLREHSVLYGHWTFLRILWQADGLTQRQLSEQAGVMEPTTFAALQAMEKLGYITRQKMPNNRKQIRICLTPKGAALQSVMVPAAEDVNRIAMAGIPEATSPRPAARCWRSSRTSPMRHAAAEGRALAAAALAAENTTGPTITVPPHLGTGHRAIGVAGLGAAGRAFIPAIRKHPGFRLAAIAEPAARCAPASRTSDGAPSHATLQAMLEQGGLDAVYIATPTELHPEHVAQVAPRASTSWWKSRWRRARAGAGHDRCRRARGRRACWSAIRTATICRSIPCATDRRRHVGPGADGQYLVLYRLDLPAAPRRRTRRHQGGGVTYRQGSHQFDIIRLLCGGKSRSVRAKTFDWDKTRSAIGAHVVYLDFEDGPAATAVYNGYGRFSSMDLGFDISEWGFLQPPESRPPLQRPGAGATEADELAAKQQRAKNAIPGSAPFQPFFGLTLVSCERGEIRQSPQGLFLYTARAAPKSRCPPTARRATW